jgi:hypothetical protein
LKPVFAICLLEGILWQDSRRVYHAFRLVDQETKRVLSTPRRKGKIELIRTLEGLLGQVPSDEGQLNSQTLEQLQTMVTELQSQLRSRMG